MTRGPDRDVLIALCARDVSAAGKAFTAAETWRLLADLRERGMRPADLLVDGAVVADGARIAQRLSALDQVERLTARYAEQDIWLLTPVDRGFPERLFARLGAAAPALLYGAGNAELLAGDGIGVVGSRDLGDWAVTLTQRLAGSIAAAGLTLVSGAARGADQVAMSAAAGRGGSVVGILVHPLERAVREEETRRLIAAGRLCLVTPFKPSTGFRPANAMARNKIVYGLTRCTAVVVAAHGRGGTWAGATEALRRGFGPVAVWAGDGADDANRALIGLGARPFTTGEELLAITRDGFAGPRRPLDQLTMPV
jgi:predicted Rossmann fold nucleotide-binding protein DprA/Smf involved in DNA uptake